METAVAVALISLGSSIAVAAWTAVWTSRQDAKGRDLQLELARQQSAAQHDIEAFRHQLERAATESERLLSAAEQLRRHREPLVEAANDLGHRVHNIRCGSFLVYLKAEHGRRDIAVLSTLYRLAKYFRTVEALYEGGNPLRFERADETRAVADVLGAIGRTFASDAYDQTNGFASSRLMIWREEQRAFGDSVRSSGSDDSVCVGFTEFVTRYENGADKWFVKVVSDLEHPHAADGERLAVLQSHLAALVRMLDVDGRYARSDVHAPEWLRR
jgi:hypothetical protein